MTDRDGMIWVVAWLDSEGNRHISKTFDTKEEAVKFMGQCEAFHGGVWQVYQRHAPDPHRIDRCI